jgi:hypothetical protein
MLVLVTGNLDLNIPALVKEVVTQDWHNFSSNFGGVLPDALLDRFLQTRAAGVDFLDKAEICDSLSVPTGRERSPPIFEVSVFLSRKPR